MAKPQASLEQFVQTLIFEAVVPPWVSRVCTSVVDVEHQMVLGRVNLPRFRQNLKPVTRQRHFLKNENGNEQVWIQNENENGK